MNVARLIGASVITCLALAAPLTAVAQDISLDGPVGLGGRVEVAEAGYAVTLPQGWLHIRPSDSDVDTIVEQVAGVVPELGPTIAQALAGGLGFSLLAFDSEVQAGFTENCNVLDRLSDSLSIDDIGAEEVAKLDGFGDLIVGEPELSFVALPSGRAARLDLNLQLPEFVTASTSYLLTDGVWIHTLTCTDLVRPDDGWLSIVQTFELLTMVR